MKGGDRNSAKEEAGKGAQSQAATAGKLQGGAGPSRNLPESLQASLKDKMQRPEPVSGLERADEEIQVSNHGHSEVGNGACGRDDFVAISLES